MKDREEAEVAEYYKQYYLDKRDRSKYQYYEKKQRKKLMDDLYKEYGGEREYYKAKMREFCKLKI